MTLLILSMILGYVGFSKHALANSQRRSPLDTLYLTLQLATIESGNVTGQVSWELEVARWSVPLLTAYTAVLTAATLFRRQLQMVRIRFTRSHVIICGLGEKGFLLAQRFLERGETVVVIEKDPSNPHISVCRDQGIIVLIGDATGEPLLMKAGAQRAKYLIAVCGDDEVNVEVGVMAHRLSRLRKRGTLNCSIHLVNPELFTLLREQEFGAEDFPTYRLEMFNIYERGARILLHTFPAFTRDTSSTSHAPHMMVVGLGHLGNQVVTQAARSWYELNPDGSKKMIISIMDPAAGEKSTTLLRRHPQMSEVCDLVPISDDRKSSAAQGMRKSLIQDNLDIPDIVYVCREDHYIGFKTSLQLRGQFGQNNPSIVVRMPENGGLATLLDSDGGKLTESRNIHAFGLIEQTCTPDLVLRGTHELLAQEIHENYLHSRLNEGMQIGQKRSMVPWVSLPEDLRSSNRRQVDLIRRKLEQAGYGIKPLVDWDASQFQFKEDDIELMARLEHEHWLEERRRAGWSYAPGHEDSERKTHPDLVPWDTLSDPAKDKDRQTVVMLPKLLASAGFQLEPVEM